jgi:uncharacterized protein (TIGR00725 family)
MSKIIIGVMGAGAEEWNEFAEPLGRLIAAKGFDLLTGGGTGVMTSVSRAYKQSGFASGRTIGIIPTIKNADGSYTPKDNYPNEYIDIPILTPLGVFDGTDPNQVSRNWVNIMTSHAIIALPGSKGTKNEILLALQFGKPTLLFGPLATDIFQDFDIPKTDQISDVELFLDGFTIK